MHNKTINFQRTTSLACYKCRYATGRGIYVFKTRYGAIRTSLREWMEYEIDLNQFLCSRKNTSVFVFRIASFLDIHKGDIFNIVSNVKS